MQSVSCIKFEPVKEDNLTSNTFQFEQMGQSPIRKRRLAVAFWDSRLIVYDVYTWDAAFKIIKDVRKYAELGVPIGIPITHIEWRTDKQDTLIINSAFHTVFEMDLNVFTGPQKSYLKPLIIYPNTPITGVIGTYQMKELLLTCSYDGLFIAYQIENVNTPKESYDILFKFEAPCNVTYFTATEFHVALVLQNSIIKVFDLYDGYPKPYFTSIDYTATLQKPISCIELMKDGKCMIVGSIEGKCEVIMFQVPIMRVSNNYKFKCHRETQLNSISG